MPLMASILWAFHKNQKSIKNFHNSVLLLCCSHWWNTWKCGRMDKLTRLMDSCRRRFRAPKLPPRSTEPLTLMEWLRSVLFRLSFSSSSSDDSEMSPSCRRGWAHTSMWQPPHDTCINKPKFYSNWSLKKEFEETCECWAHNVIWYPISRVSIAILTKSIRRQNVFSF